MKPLHTKGDTVLKGGCMRYEKRSKEFEPMVRYSLLQDEGFPNRERIISEDEILNLRILLNTETDFDELLERL